MPLKSKADKSENSLISAQSAKLKSGQFICYQTGQVYLLLTQKILNKIYNVIYCLKTQEQYQAEQEYRLFVPYILETFQRLARPETVLGDKKILKFPLSYQCIEKIFISPDTDHSKLTEILNALNLPLSLLVEYNRS